MNAARVASTTSRGRRWKSCLFSSGHSRHRHPSPTSAYGALPQTPEFIESGRMAPGKASSPRSAVPFLGAYRTFRTTRVALQQSPIRSGGGPNGKQWIRGCQRNRRFGEVFHFCSDKFCPLLLSPLHSLTKDPPNDFIPLWQCPQHPIPIFIWTHPDGHGGTARTSRSSRLRWTFSSMAPR